jgi:hypothetical protein
MFFKRHLTIQPRSVFSALFCKEAVCLNESTLINSLISRVTAFQSYTAPSVLVISKE